MAIIRRIAALWKSRNHNDAFKRHCADIMYTFDRGVTMRFGVHGYLFRQALFVQGTAEQFALYKQVIDDFAILGCFAMTELGHSSHLKGLETTATYDPQHQEFIIHTPTITATKWWIGLSGHVCTILAS